MAYIGPTYVPDGTPGSTPGAPEGTTSNSTEFMGFQPPLTPIPGTLPNEVAGYRDANGKFMEARLYANWQKAYDQEQKVKDLQAKQAAGEIVAPADMALALDQYRDAIGAARAQYESIMGHEPTPSPTEVLTLPTSSTVDPSKTSTVSPAERLAAALQQGTKVEGTTLDTAQADEARNLQLQGVKELQASAQGQGQAQRLAAARLQQALRSGAKQGAGIALGSTGAARKGAALAGVLAANQNAIDAGSKIAETEAATALQAQGQLASALQGVRSQDTTQAAQKAQLDQERKTLQAQLDAAKASNDQDAINAVNAKMADLDQRTKEFNAAEQNKTQARQEDQNFEGQKVAIDRGLKVSELTEAQRIANERLKLDASKAATDAAAGLLSENDRQAQLKLAYDKLNAAEEEAEKAFWRGIVTSLISRAAGAAVPGPPKAAHGGLVTESTLVEVGEAGPELIIPVDNVTARLAKALALGKKPFDRKDAPDLATLLKLLKQKPEDKPARKVPPKVVAILAAGNSENRKKY